LFGKLHQNFYNFYFVFDYHLSRAHIVNFGELNKKNINKKMSQMGASRSDTEDRKRSYALAEREAEYPISNNTTHQQQQVYEWKILANEIVILRNDRVVKYWKRQNTNCYDFAFVSKDTTHLVVFGRTMIDKTQTMHVYCPYDSVFTKGLDKDEICPKDAWICITFIILHPGCVDEPISAVVMCTQQGLVAMGNKSNEYVIFDHESGISLRKKWKKGDFRGQTNRELALYKLLEESITRDVHSKR